MQELFVQEQHIIKDFFLLIQKKIAIAGLKNGCNKYRFTFGMREKASS